MKKIAAKTTTAWQMVHDQHKPPRRVRGLWRRGENLYAALDANNGKAYYYPLHVDTVPQAVAARQELKSLQAQGKLLPPSDMKLGDGAPKPAPKSGDPGISLADAVKGYQTDRDALKLKDELTADREDSGLTLWIEKFGTMPFEDVTSGTLIDFGTWRKKVVAKINKQRQKEGSTKKEVHVSGRTIDLNVLALRHVRAWAKKKGHISADAPDWEWEKLADKPATDGLLEPKQMDELCNAALLDSAVLELIDKKCRHLRLENAVSGQYFHDYLRLLQYAGGRANETTMQAWPNVTWSRKADFDGDGGKKFKKGDRIPGKLFFPGVNAKAGGGEPAEDRWVPFSILLDKHLLAMYARRDPSSDWMFPKRRGGKGHTLRFHKQLERVKRELRAKHCDPDDEKSYWFDRVTFQWFRHYFISHCVMANIDYKTIATWVSHRDGGVLIGKIYGHLNTEHSEDMSDKLSEYQTRRR
jgi:integrase